ncbi:MAG TPA: aspartyl/asparaginyl beta-hydroxylase domain-containing protein [Rhizomicrobium sp.]|nr:aspartyl/asparaginyl beta-hydroxylase domain-containing protein [Rhizomicrobium sp.]
MSAAPTRLDEAVQRAGQAMAAGRADEAARLWQLVLSQSPDNPQALLHLGQIALQKRDIAAARGFLERAAKSAPQNPVIPLNLSYAARAAGDSDGELAALTRALTIDPYFYPALLAKGMLMERTGQTREAARVYRNVLKIAPPADQLPPPLKAPLAHAADVVRDNAAAMERFLDGRMSPVRAQFPEANWSRLDECRDIAAGVKRAYTVEPHMLHVPRLPAIQFYDEADFPWLKELEAASDAMREEFLAVYKKDNEGFVPYIDYPDGTPVNQWVELNRSPRWSVFYLWKDGKKVEANCARCPKSVEAMKAVPLADIPNFAPTVLFSLLAPKTTIPAHTGDTNARLIVHLPLIVPEGCRFRVGNETREWKVGKAWVFDDTIDHEAWNDSDELRVIVMIDIWNPHLNDAERAMAREILNGVRDYFAHG